MSSKSVLLFFNLFAMSCTKSSAAGGDVVVSHGVEFVSLGPGQCIHPRGVRPLPYSDFEDLPAWYGIPGMNNITTLKDCRDACAKVPGCPAFDFGNNVAHYPPHGMCIFRFDSKEAVQKLDLSKDDFGPWHNGCTENCLSSVRTRPDAGSCWKRKEGARMYNLFAPL